jgi:hypothetical protein
MAYNTCRTEPLDDFFESNIPVCSYKYYLLAGRYERKYEHYII